MSYVETWASDLPEIVCLGWGLEKLYERGRIAYKQVPYKNVSYPAFAYKHP